MTVLQVVRSVCATVGVAVPQSIFSSLTGNRTMVEMLEQANEMAQRIAYDYRDWTALRTTHTINGDSVWDPVSRTYSGGSTAFDLPANYKRLLLTSNVWRSSSSSTPMAFVSDTDEWLNHRLRNTPGSAFGEWALFGHQMHIYPVLRGPKPAVIEDPGPPYVPPESAVPPETAVFTYMDKNCVQLASGGYGDSFLSDGDSFVLDERLLKLGMVWNWKQNKGASYAEELGTFGDAMAVAMGHDSPGPIIVGRLPLARTAGPGAWSWPS
jgi:hypothetical protein